MRGAEGVVFAFLAAREAGDAAYLRSVLHALAPAGENLVRIGLMTDVPHQPVVRGVEDVMQRDGQLDRAEIGRQMPAGARLPTRAETAAARPPGAAKLAVELTQLGGT